MKPDNVEIMYRIMLESSEYPRFTMARWVRAADLPRFHIMRTIEAYPQDLTIHESNIFTPTPKEIQKHIAILE